MKLRLLNDSIRLRLSRSEVVAADEQGVVEGRTQLPDGAVFTYAVEALKTGPASASYVRNRMVVRFPAAEISAWANDDEAVSLSGELKLPEGGPLRVLVEKDFKCVTPRGDEDQSDLFKNPEGNC
jgi:Family of unknown function (DUF7009)